MNPLETLKSWSGRVRQFYDDVRGEMKKVSWPPRQEVIGTTIVVIVAVFFFGAYLALVDSLIYNGVEKVFAYFGVNPN